MSKSPKNLDRLSSESCRVAAPLISGFKMDADLTDDELRAELVQFGQDVGPITTTTRKVWLKRLGVLRTNAKKTAKKASKSRKLVGLSSDESQQSDGEEAGSSRKGRASPSRSRSGKLSLTKASTVPARASRTAPPTSEPVFVAPKISPKKTRSGPNSKPKQQTIPAIHLAEFSESDGNSSADEPMEIGESNRNNHSLGLKFEPVLPPSRRRRSHMSIPSYLQTTVTGRRSLSDLRRTSGGHVEIASGHDSFQNDVSMSSPPRSMLSMGINTTPSLDPSLSFMETSDVSLGQSYLSDDAPTPRREGSNHVGEKKDEDYISHGFKTKEDEKEYRYSQYISCGLVFSVAAIFVGIACIYLVNVAVHTKEQGGGGRKALPANMSSSERCIYSLLDYLSTVAGEALCRTLPGGGQVSVQDAKANAQGSSNAETWKAALRKLIEKPDWGVKLTTKEGMLAEGPSEVVYLESQRPNMSFLCRFKRSFHKLILLSGVLVAALILVAGVAYVVRLYKRRKEDAKRQFYDLVEEIMDTLQQHASACKQNKDLKPYLAIPHVRDMLIPPGERQQKKKLWERAVAFLEANESRIRAESQVIMGEEFLVWRWLPSVSEAAPQSTSSGRVWQGQAFADTKTVKPHYSPTSCLKVRNMFDACVEFGEEWPTAIQDAILEKCLSTCPRVIHHIAVDKNSKEGCVYIKCESREGAGLVYKALHGWWFDGKLVTVKYLREERYLERFPESSAFNLALTPSNNKMLSMAAQS